MTLLRENRVERATGRSIAVAWVSSRPRPPPPPHGPTLLLVARSRVFLRHWPHRVGNGQKRHPAREPVPLRHLATLRALAFLAAHLGEATAATRRARTLRDMPPVTLRRTSFARALSPASDGKRNSPLEGGGENRGNEVPAVSWGLFGAVQGWGREDMVDGEGGPGKGRGRGAGWVGMSWSLSTSSILYNQSIIDYRSSIIDDRSSSSIHALSRIEHISSSVDGRASHVDHWWSIAIIGRSINNHRCSTDNHRSASKPEHHRSSTIAQRHRSIDYRSSIADHHRALSVDHHHHHQHRRHHHQSAIIGHR